MKADPRRPKQNKTWLDRPVPNRYRQPPAAAARGPARRHKHQKVSSVGTIHPDKVFYEIDVDHAFKQVLVVSDGAKIIVTDLQGEILAEHTGLVPGITYVGNGRQPGTRARTQKCHRSPDADTVTLVLRHYRIRPVGGLL